MTPSPNKPNLSALRQQRLNALGSGYSWFVKIAKLALPIAALVVIGIVVANLNENAVEQQIVEMPKDAAQTTPGQIELIAARYEGTDEKGQAYTVSADKATRGTEKDSVLLDKPKGDLMLENKSWLAVHADKGTYSMDSGHLNLSDNVRLFHDAGYELLMESAAIDIKTRNATSDKPVKGHGPLGEIAAQSLRIDNGGENVVFGGPVTLKIYRLKGSRG